MAKVQTTVGPMKGRMGGVTFFVQNGQQMMITSKRSVRNPKTEAQMKQRIKMNNIHGAYHHMKGFLQNTFEGMTGGRNAAIFFRSHNLMLKPVWMTMNQKLNNDFVLAPFVVSNGLFPSIAYRYEDGCFVSDLKIGDLKLTEDTTVALLSNILLQNNDNWSQGDTLEVILMRQAIPSEMADITLPDSSAVSIEISNGNNETLKDLKEMESLSRNKVEIKLLNKDGYLAVKAEGTYAYALAMIHTRGSKQTLRSSSQSMCLSNSALYDYYTGDEALTAALKSYKTQGYK